MALAVAVAVIVAGEVVVGTEGAVRLEWEMSEYSASSERWDSAMASQTRHW